MILQEFRRDRGEYDGQEAYGTYDRSRDVQNSGMDPHRRWLSALSLALALSGIASAKWPRRIRWQRGRRGQRGQRACGSSTLAGSPASHDHDGHLSTSKSPAATNSSGVSTPFCLPPRAHARSNEPEPAITRTHGTRATHTNVRGHPSPVTLSPRVLRAGDEPIMRGAPAARPQRARNAAETCAWRHVWGITWRNCETCETEVTLSTDALNTL